MKVRRRLARGLAAAVGLLVVAAASIAFGLKVTPAQSVSSLGQTVEVGAADPELSISGPGVLDLFGQSLPTRATFTGPVRPRLVLTRITINQQVADFLAPKGRSSGERALGRSLAAGWTRYFLWEVAFVGVGALILGAAVVGIRRTSLRRSLLGVGSALFVAEALNLGFVMLTAYSAPSVLSKVTSLSALVGRRDEPPVRVAPGAPVHGVNAVVLGDSTAAGLGLPLVGHATALDKACFRSGDAYATALGQANSWDVENLACSGATIRAGILGGQDLGAGLSAPPQLALAKRIAQPRALLLSVGADDLRWDALVRLCAASKSCDDAASTAYFQSELHGFTEDYYQLLAQLTEFGGRAKVVVNQYYNPFDGRSHCLDHVGLTPAKQRVLVRRLDALNAVLAKGASASGFDTVQPDFSGHELCSPLPYVQGLAGQAPFHPTADGELAIALADERVLGPRS